MKSCSEDLIVSGRRVTGCIGCYEEGTLSRFPADGCEGPRPLPTALAADNNSPAQCAFYVNSPRSRQQPYGRERVLRRAADLGCERERDLFQQLF